MYKGKDFEAVCESLIKQLVEDLTPPDEVITSGYISDPKILHDAEDWFKNNIGRFDNGDGWGRASDVWWSNGFGMLQCHKLSVRDAHVVKEGIGNWSEKGKIPLRSLNNSDGSSYFFNSSPKLGQKFYFAYYGAVNMGSTGGRWRRGEAVKNLCRAKTVALQNLCNMQRPTVSQSRALGV